MIQRIRTSTVTSINLDKIQTKYKLSTKASILRICISVSLKDDSNPLDYLNNLENKEGFDISFPTLFGEQEVLYKALIKCHADKILSESEFADYVLAHIERGMIGVYGEFAVTGSFEEFMLKLI